MIITQTKTVMQPVEVTERTYIGTFEDLRAVIEPLATELSGPYVDAVVTTVVGTNRDPGGVYTLLAIRRLEGLRDLIDATIAVLAR